jgi:hypothetical protein
MRIAATWSNLLAAHRAMPADVATGFDLRTSD